VFNIGTGEIALIAVAALLLLGPKRLPELARGIGKFMREFKKQTDDVRTVVEREFYRMDQDLSIHEAPGVPDVVAANSVARVAENAALAANPVTAAAAAAPTEPEALAPPAESTASQVTQGATPGVPVPAGPPEKPS
jgi:sec-independent protein translocase protein TatB